MVTLLTQHILYFIYIYVCVCVAILYVVQVVHISIKKNAPDQTGCRCPCGTVLEWYHKLMEACLFPRGGAEQNREQDKRARECETVSSGEP